MGSGEIKKRLAEDCRRKSDICGSGISRAPLRGSGRHNRRSNGVEAGTTRRKSSRRHSPHDLGSADLATWLRETRPSQARSSPSADKMASGKKSEQVTAKQTVTALAAPFSPREARQESSTSMVPIEEDGRAMVEQGLPALSFLPLPHGGQPEATNMASYKESEQAIAKQPMPAMTNRLSTCEGEQDSSTILGDKDQRAIADHSLSVLPFLRSPRDGQPDAIKMVSGEENEQATTNQPVTTMTTPLPPRERQREFSATPILEDQPTIVDHHLTTVTFLLSSPQDGQPRTSEMANAKESEQVTANQPITALGTPLPPCEVQQVSVVISGAEYRAANLHQPLSALTSSLSPHDGRRDTIKVVSGKECELSTASQSVTAPSLAGSSCVC
ncbi:hypothetical protein HPB50_001154 [Hyalomma asiaticum]|uniref:Uncharacterized protein n=1 Tax=Hyalomma asiaticum TaxID=266040 RepID=A0ACB7TCY8_HYAAI|nr:hypothetical protein HPB50_001154 [Hyalomma asiaticum]